MNYTGRFSPGASDVESVRFDFGSLPDHGHSGTFKVPDAHLLFSGDYLRSGSDLIISDHLHRVVVRGMSLNLNLVLMLHSLITLSNKHSLNIPSIHPISLLAASLTEQVMH